MLQIHKWFLNTYTAKDVCLRFPSIIWFLQLSCYFLFLIEARDIFIGSTLNPALNSTLKAVYVHALVSFP